MFEVGVLGGKYARVDIKYGLGQLGGGGGNAVLVRLGQRHLVVWTKCLQLNLIPYPVNWIVDCLLYSFFGNGQWDQWDNYSLQEHVLGWELETEHSITNRKRIVGMWGRSILSPRNSKTPLSVDVMLFSARM